MHKILVVEDALDVQAIVKSLLGKKYDVTFASTAAEAEREMKQNSFPLIILDIGLPDENGLQLCAKIRMDDKYKNAMIIFLTGKDQVSDKVLGFSVGADDYIVKPINSLEFTARIDAKIRRLEDTKKDQEVFARGPFRINLPFQKAYIQDAKEDKDLNLTSIEFKLLYFFLQHEEHVLSREKILNEVWGTTVHVTDRTVDTHIYTLRQKLGEYAGCIHSVPRMGYKLSHKWMKNAA